MSGTLLESTSHPIQGVGYGISDLKFVEKIGFDDTIAVSGKEAQETARNLARTEGIFAGYSSGANVAAAIKLLRGKYRGKTIIVVVCDSGLKYLSTDLWTNRCNDPESPKNFVV